MHIDMLPCCLCGNGKVNGHLWPHAHVHMHTSFQALSNRKRKHEGPRIGKHDDCAQNAATHAVDPMPLCSIRIPAVRHNACSLALGWHLSGFSSYPKSIWFPSEVTAIMPTSYTLTRSHGHTRHTPLATSFFTEGHA